MEENKIAAGELLNKWRQIAASRYVEIKEYLGRYQGYSVPFIQNNLDFHKDLIEWLGPEDCTFNNVN
jgi:hypothetical protein